MLIKLLTVFIFTSHLIYGQSDWVKWEAKQNTYEITDGAKFKIVPPAFNTGSKIISAARTIYKTFFSDLDGDNCPFHPSCSQFYVDAVRETNLLKGTLMFADRFTRDLNFFKGLNHYPIDNSSKFFDPVYNYTLDASKINLRLPENPTE